MTDKILQFSVVDGQGGHMLAVMSSCFHEVACTFQRALLLQAVKQVSRSSRCRRTCFLHVLDVPEGEAGHQPCTGPVWQAVTV